ncbi:Down syndrome cell adhesion molecule homolog [Copidosoma floridanum]|uniref:Down syndrome cell adhesion molecule homolog n=1 Tax=Copidosoma floridanum TaxID=29053 RepID=UPI0006C9B3A8|nr:Down syndrome cell adhesion molecule homolog [Copidosoma floridanum]
MRTSSCVNYYVLCLVCWVLLGITGVSTKSHLLVKRYGGLYTGPYIDAQNVTNVTVQLGTFAYLPCKVRQIGNKSVSWVRTRDAHILAVDRTVFIADDRFESRFIDSTSTWALVVKYAQERDEGEYECQISTEPKLSHTVNLTVVVPKIEILGDKDLHVNPGSKVVLQCVIKHSLEIPFTVFWYHHERQLPDQRRNRMTIQTKVIDGTNNTASNLTIENTVLSDSGNYTCRPSNLDSTSVQLHVLNGEHPAAIQRGISSVPGCCRFLCWFAGALSLTASESERGRLCGLLLVGFAVAVTQTYLPPTSVAWTR